MPSYVPPKKNTSFVFETAFVDTASRPDFKAAPTIASGDFKISIDGTSGVALAANPAALSGATNIVRFSISGAEMNGDIISIMCIDAAGGEWDDQLITIHTAANLNDDLATIISANLAAINSNAVGISANATLVAANTVLISANLTAINSNATAIAANLAAINSNATALGILKSDTVVVRSDTLAILADTGTTLPAQISANLTAINSNAVALGVVKSDLVVIRSDTLFVRSDVASVLTDTGTTIPGLVSANLTAINSNATAIAVMKSDTLATRSDAVAILADTGTTLPAQISGNLTAINSNAVGISANLTAVNSNAVVLGVLKSDSVVIRSDTLAIRAAGADTTLQSAILTAVNSNAVGISANLTAINSNAVGISANATAIAGVGSDSVVVRSDTLGIRALLDDARGEPGQGAPPVNPDAMTKIDYLYKNWRNLKEQTSDTFTLYNDDATTAGQKSAVSDDGTTASKGEVGTGA